MRPSDLHVEQGLFLAVVAAVAAKWIVKVGPLHTLLWIVAIGAVVVTTTKFGSEVLG